VTGDAVEDKEVPMKRLVIIAVVGAALLAAGVGVAIAIAATTGSSGGSIRGRATVSVKHLAGVGTVLVDTKGRALYKNDEEHGGNVLCTGACLSFWKPLIVATTPTASSSLPGKLAVVTRADGRRQVTYNAKPLYTFTLDKPGKVTGDGFKDSFGRHKFAWHVVHSTAVGNSPSTTTGGTQTNTYTYPGY
jgi:predicted lipoprotein with Yx(FWY)xxD motif